MRQPTAAVPKLGLRPHVGFPDMKIGSRKNIQNPEEKNIHTKKDIPSSYLKIIAMWLTLKI